MARLIEDLLDVTRISRGRIRLQRESLDLSDVVRGTGEDLRALFRGSGIEFVISMANRPIRGFGDKTRIAQIVGSPHLRRRTRPPAKLRLPSEIRPGAP